MASCILSDARAFERRGIVNIFNRLNLGEVVSATDGAEVGIELRGLQIRCGEIIADIFIPRVFEVEIQSSPAVKLGVATDEVRFEQRHAATDVAADEVRINNTLGLERRANRRASARMQIRKADRVPDAVQLRGGVELAHRFTFDPALGRGEKAYLSFCRCVHISFFARQSGIGLSGRWSRNCADTSCASNRRAD